MSEIKDLPLPSQLCRISLVKLKNLPQVFHVVVNVLRILVFNLVLSPPPFL